ncbi:hypothetical protein L1987_55267 [Smallanthus sonchifolius]|uniref:Uncharacterized protein n=1 Tax=Smallanthus sonchifolius TaxID=185202 RepID=A0ACB9E9S5_9ASTR|nr:hypothetical protein L1987_55267 [Smallanthus sonchifolius]
MCQFKSGNFQADMFISKRKHEPAHYMLTIESFSILSEAKTSKIESDVFEASGHKWRLDLYPNGNNEGDKGSHISLYAVICDTESCSKGWEVCVDVCFFVYDHIHHHYVTFQDANGHRTKKVRLYPKGNDSDSVKDAHLSTFLVVHDAASFPAGWKVYAKFKFRVKSQSSKSDIEEEIDHWFCSSYYAWGFPTFMPLNQLNDFENDFLLNDNLTVEVEISVMGTLRCFI